MRPIEAMRRDERFLSSAQIDKLYQAMYAAASRSSLKYV